MVSASAGHRAIGPDIPELSPETSDIPRGQVEGCLGSVEAGQGQSLCLLSWGVVEGAGKLQRAKAPGSTLPWPLESTGE